MSNRKKTSKRKAPERGLRTASSGGSDILPISNPRPSSLYGNQLASPPASSGLAVPSNSPEVQMHNPNRLVDRARNRGTELSREVSQPTAGVNGDSAGVVTSSSDAESEPPQRPSRSQTRYRAVPEHDTTGGSKSLSLKEKVKLLRISCSNGVRFLHSPTFGKHAEEEVWTTIMEEFSRTVRAGFFTKYSQVKKMNNKICRNRRKRTEGTVPPERRSQMRDLDTWIDRWVRVWKCRDLVISIANAHQSIRETIGEKKLKRIFGHRMDGNELPSELGVLTFSAPLWKAIQKRIRTVERSLRKRHYSLFPGDDESDWMDEDEIEDNATVGAIGEGTPLQSIEEEFQSEPFPEAQGNLTVTPSREAGTESPYLPAPSPRTQAMLDQFEQNCVSILKDEQSRTGKQISVLGLAQKNARHEPSPIPVPDIHNESRLEGNTVVAPEPQPLSSYSTSYFSKMDDKLEHNASGSCVENPTLEPTLEPTPRGEANTRRNVGANSSGLRRLTPGTYSAGKPVADGESRCGQGDSASTPFRSQSRKRSRCHSTGNSQSDLARSLDTTSLRPATVSESPTLSSSRDHGRPPKRQKHSSESESVLNTRPATGSEDQNRRSLFSSSKAASAAPGNHASREELGTPNDGPGDKGKGKVAQSQSHQDNHWEPNPGPSTKSGHGHPSNWGRGGKRKFPSSRRSSYEQPIGPSTSATPWKRPQIGRWKRGRRPDFGRHSQGNSGNNRNGKGNRFLREETTDMADFENFSLDGKCDFLRRQISQMKEVLREVRK
ncbi:hypothetical protein F4776DRAFT_658024 [Hypoxylon sp. NC0597]|nr:hypothetical protein F4776DRAFT_658024 [Hypoxylon sp. NC0597]